MFKSAPLASGMISLSSICDSLPGVIVRKTPILLSSGSKVIEGAESLLAKALVIVLTEPTLARDLVSVGGPAIL